ncbi:MAG TPA: P-II family nitrogen regulator [Rhodospirillales bacterium]|jgi:nitrogen regulatory protein P-II 1|nr:P-II family nitrogen regulator [Candidatus Latescibacterota bacterium]HJO98179.1 P-II family nitrogen regulator [Rhodospirillales bacterium]
MKLIIAIFKAEKLDEVREALTGKEITRMTLSRVSGHGRARHRTGLFRGREVDIPLMPKIRMEIACNDEFKDEIVNLILHSARTEGDSPGDGKIFVLPLEECTRIRTGETGEEAI